MRDSLNRLTTVKRFRSSGTEDLDQRTVYEWDTATNGWGRIGKITYSGASIFPREEFSYTVPGQVSKKRLVFGSSDAYAEVQYGYGSDGQVVTVKYPDHCEVTGSDGNYTVNNFNGQQLTYEFDEMNRPKKLTGDGGLVYTDLVQYNAAGQIISGTFLGRIETYQFNERGQLTRQTQQLGVDIGYTFSPTANDGRLWKRKNYVSGEEVEYQYDALGRLSSAATVGAGGWGQSFVHDGFGNLLQQNVTKGSAPTMNLSINGNTNRVNGQFYDANGNWLGESGQPQMVYDIENRLAETPGGAEKYKYSVSGHRIMVQSGTTYRYHLYGIDGQLLGVYRPEWKPGANYCAKEDILLRRTYFAGRLLYYGENPTLNGAVVLDRLGTAGDNYPYGGATLQVDHKVGFATYTRDSSGLDYAVNRYYKSSWGRFTTADPYQASGGPADPGSWNRYSYVGGDPVNSHDPSGLLMAFPCGPNWMWDASLSGPCASGSGGWNDFSAGGRPWHPCISSGSYFAPTTECILLLAWLLPGEEERPQQSICSVEVRFRMVEGPGFFYNHAYIQYRVISGPIPAGMSSLGGVLEGQPEHEMTLEVVYRPVYVGIPPMKQLVLFPVSVRLSWGHLVMSDSPFGTGNRPSIDPKWGRTQTGAWVCDAIVKMINAVNRYQRSPVDYAPLGPNSNGTVKYLLEAGGLLGYFSAPTLTEGWDVPIR